MKVEVVQGAREKERDGEADAECLSPSVLWPKTTLRLKFALAAHLLSTSPCLFFDSRFTVLVFSLALIPQTLNNITAPSVKPPWWCNTSEEVICDTCDIQSPLPLLSHLSVQTEPSNRSAFTLQSRKIFTKTQRAQVLQARAGAAAKSAAIKYDLSFLSPWSSV